MTIAVRSPFLEFGCILPPTEGELYELVLQSKIILDKLRHIGLLEAKRGKYSTRALWQYRFLSLGRLHVPREVDLADKTRDRSDLSMSARSASLGTYSLPKDIKNFELSARVLYFKHRSRPRARPVWQRFCSCPPPAGQYELYTPLIVYRISRMLYCSWAISKHLIKPFQIKNPFMILES